MQIVYTGLLLFSSNSFCSDKKLLVYKHKAESPAVIKTIICFIPFSVGQRHFLSSQINYTFNIPLVVPAQMLGESCWRADQ